MAKLVLKNSRYVVQGVNITLKVHKSNVLLIKEFIGGTKVLLKNGSFIAFSETSEPVYFAPRR